MIESSTSWTVFLELLPQMKARGFELALWGARALSAHGVVRDTVDVDVVFSESSRDVLGLLRDRGLRVAHFATDHFLVSSTTATSIDDHIDVFFPLVEPAQSAAKKPVLLDVEGHGVPTAPAATLVAAKLMASSALQNGDAWLALDAALVSPREVRRELDKVERLTRHPDRVRRHFEDVAGARHRLALWERHGWHGTQAVHEAHKATRKKRSAR